MKIFVVCLLFSVIFAGYAFAQNCQYTVNETYSEMVTGFFSINGSYMGPGLSFTNFTNGAGSLPPKYTIHNPISRKLNISLTHVIINVREGVQIRTIPVELLPYSDVVIEWNPPSEGQNYFDQNRITYSLIEPADLLIKTDYVTFVREICTPCNPCSDVCITDYQSCTKDCECGSGICNMCGKCGTKGSSFLDCTCPSGTFNCKNISCAIPYSKNFGETYSCPQECKSNVGNNITCLKGKGEICSKNDECGYGFCNIMNVCDTENKCPNETLNCKNQSCQTPSLKLVGQAYKCEFECNSSRGENGVCQESWIIVVGKWLGLIAAFLIFVTLWKFVILTWINNKRKEAQIELFKIKEETKNKKEELSKIIVEIKQKQNKLKHETDRISKEIDNLKIEHKKKIELLERDLETAKQVNKKQIENQIKKSQAEFNNKIKNLQINFESKTKEYEEKNEELIEKEKIQETYKNKLNNWENRKPYVNNQRQKVFLNDNGYEVFVDKNNKPTAKLFHVFWYEKKSKEPSEKNIDTSKFNIHHIDGNKSNNEFWNLIKIDKELHDIQSKKSIHKNNPPWSDYEKGVEILKKAGIEIPERVKKHLEEINSKSTTLNDFEK
jgi:hypothetical protein